MNLSRTSESSAAFARAQFPRIDYLAMYGGAVIAQKGSNAFDFLPDDQRIPGMSGIPIKLPFPGFSLTLDMSAKPRALLGWQNGDPSLPELRLWEASGLGALVVQASHKLSFVAPAVNVGGDPGAESMPLFQTYRTAEDTFFTALITALTTTAAALTAAGAVPTSAAVAPAGTALAAVSTLLPTFQSAAAAALSQICKNS